MNRRDVPGQLTVYDRWLTWRNGLEDGKSVKIPISCHTGRKANAYDPKNWVPFDEAFDYLEQHSGNVDGVGFAFDCGPGMDPIAGVDLDDCRNHETGEISPWATAIIERLKSYTEVSPSGTGVKIFLRGRLPDGHHTEYKKDGVSIEVYTTKRYFTVTGRHVKGTPADIETRHEELPAFYREIFGGTTGEVMPKVEVFDEPPYHDLSDDEIISKASAAENGEKFRKLFFDGDVGEYNNDDSRADQALADILAFWCGPNSARIEGLFGRSALARQDKWHGRKDYRDRTITKAIRRQKEGDLFYRPVKCALASVARPTDDVEEAALEIARELVGTIARLPQYTVAFSLARRFRQLGSSPHQFEAAVRGFCRLANRCDTEDLWINFVAVWDVIIHPDGEDILDLAAKLGDEQPYPHVPEEWANKPLYAKLASMAWHLWELKERTTFFFSPKRTTSLLGCSEQTLSCLKKLMEKDGLIKMVEDYSHPLKEKSKQERDAQGKPKPARCRLYAFAGPQL